MKILNFYNFRQHFKEEYTIGNLYCVGFENIGKLNNILEHSYICNILEDKFRGNDLSKNKVSGQTCIPEGTYQIVMSESNRFKRELPELLKVPYFEGVRIHSGNTAKDTEGCLLPGENKEVGKVINSKKYETEIIEKIKQYDLIYITIKNIGR